MNKKIAIILLPVILISTLLSGCLNNDEQIEYNTDQSYFPPMPIINAHEKAYFEEPIEFDASKSKDKDGKIELYSWIFGDGEKAEGATVTHTYEFDNNFTREYPLIFQVVLEIIDNDDIPSYSIHYISLFPRGYIFYLDKEKLTVEKPSSNKDTMRASFGKLKLNPLKELTYELPSPINIPSSSWNATIYLEKPWFSIVNRVLLTLYNENGETIAEADSSFRLFKLWKEKTVLIEGETVKSEEFKSIKLVVYGFSLREKINILYGGEKASKISFDFTY